MSNILLALLCIVASLLAYFYYKIKKIHETWSSRGIPHEKPVFFFGNMNKQVSYSVLLKEICDKFPDAPFVGFYEFTRPRLLVKDSELVEKVLIKDFQHFADHGFEMDETKDPLDITLFNMSGKKWKAYRNKLSPVFTTGKLKIMHEQMNAIGESMDKWLDEQDLTGLELRDIMGRFAMDVISSFAFGFDAGSIANPDSEFRRVGKKSVEITKTQMAKFIFMACCPDLSKKLCLGFSRADVRDYFVNIVKDTMKYRTENNVRRNDILDLLLQIKQKGSVEITTKDPGDDYLGIDEHYVTDSFELTDNLIIGTAFGFLTAGFEATAISMIWACYELTQNEQIQDRLRQEISEKVEKHGKLDFEALKEMQYLEMCLKETLRKYPPVGGLLRVCTKEYEFPGGYLVKKGDSVMIPVHAIQHNPDYYPDPEKFDPERFAPDVSQRPCTFLPFGEGPRVCLAMRFAMLQIKFGLAKILTSYKLKLSTKTELPIVHSRKAIFTSPEKPIYFDLIKC